MNTKIIIRSFIEDCLRKMRKTCSFEDSDNLFEKKIVNSLFAMKLIKFIEETFDITVEEEELIVDNFNSVNNIVNFLSVKQSLRKN